MRRITPPEALDERDFHSRRRHACCDTQVLAVVRVCRCQDNIEGQNHD